MLDRLLGGGVEGRRVVKDRSQRAIQSTSDCVSYGRDVRANVCDCVVFRIQQDTYSPVFVLSIYEVLRELSDKPHKVQYRIYIFYMETQI